MITVRFFGAARQEAGSSEVQVEAESLELLLERVAVGNLKLQEVLKRCSFLIDGVVAHERQQMLTDGSVIDVLPPFAGG